MNRQRTIAALLISLVFAVPVVMVLAGGDEPPPTEVDAACCLFDCTPCFGVPSPGACTSLGGVHFPGTACADVFCPVPPPEDLNGDLAVNVLDLILVLLRFGEDCSDWQEPPQ